MQREVVAAAMVYSVCSSGMLLVNKVVLTHIPAPACVTVCQFVCCAAFVSVAKACGRVEVEVLQWSRLRHFVLYVASFVMGTYSNMRALASTNVETVIVARCCSPLAVVGIDYIAYGREAPTTRSSCALMLVAIGAATYVWVDRGFRAHGLLAYRWVAVWWTTTVFQLTYGKFLVTAHWTAVLVDGGLLHQRVRHAARPRDCVLDRGGRDGVGGRVLVARGTGVAGRLLRGWDRHLMVWIPVPEADVGHLLHCARGGQQGGGGRRERAAAGRRGVPCRPVRLDGMPGRVLPVPTSAVAGSGGEGGAGGEGRTACGVLHVRGHPGLTVPLHTFLHVLC